MYAAISKIDSHCIRNENIYKLHKKINELARVSGCPADKTSGLYLHSQVGEKIKKGDKLLAIYAESEPRLKEAIKFYNKEKIIKIR